MIPWSSLAERLNGDGEFRLGARLWTATVRLDVGDESHRLRLEDGQVRDVEPCDAASACDVFVSAPRDTWDRMLEPTPRPFYQDLFAAATHHGVLLNADSLDVAAYYPALRRLLEVLREARGGE